MYRFVHALRDRKDDGTSKKSSACFDVLIGGRMVQFIAGKDSIAGEFFHTFTRSWTRTARSLFSADSRRARESMILGRTALKSRSASVRLVVDLHPPTMQLCRLASAQKRSMHSAQELPPVSKFEAGRAGISAHRITTNVRVN